MTSLLLERVAKGRITKAREAFEGYKVLRLTGPFLGFNYYQTPDTIPQGLGKSGLVQTPDSLNMYSYPFGAMTSFPGHVNLNASAANSGKAITGFAYLGEISQKLRGAGPGKVGEDVAGTWTDRTGAASITDDDDNFMRAAFLNDIAVLTFLKKDAPLKWTGAGDVATLGGSPRSGVKGCFSWDGRMWLVSDQNADYSLKNNPESYDLTDDTINFRQTTGAGTSDGSIITSWTVAGDYVYIGMGGINAVAEHLFRIFRTGNPARPYEYERIETGGVGPISNEATKFIGQDLIFFGKDSNVHLVRGNVYLPNGIGRDIQRTILSDYSKTRFEFASMGILRERGLLGLSMSVIGGATHSRGWWYDYVNSVPGDPAREIWHPTDHVINVFGERISSGQRQLLSGGYDGFYERHLSGDSYAGSAYTKRYTLPWVLLGDYFLTHYVLGVVVAFQTTGNFNVTLNYRADFSQTYISAGTFNVGGGFILGSGLLGTDALGGKDVGLAYVTLNTAARRLQLQFVNTVISAPYTIYAAYLLIKPLYQGVNV
mgnify:CR=1 FL=1